MKQEAFFVENSRGLKLACVLHLPAGEPKPTWVILNHGMLSTKDSEKHILVAERLCALGFAVERHDFSGQGESEGREELITYSNGVDDLQCVQAELTRRGAQDFLLVGSSMGTAISMLVAAQKPEAVAGMVLMAALPRTGIVYNYMDEAKQAVWREQGHYMFNGRPVAYDIVDDGLKLDIAASLATYTGPVFFVHGTNDELIDYHEVEKLAERHTGQHELFFIENADHRFSEASDRERMVDKICDWVTRHIG